MQKFRTVHASIHNHFNHQRHLNRRITFKQARCCPGRVALTCNLTVLDCRFLRSGPVSLTMPAEVFAVSGFDRVLTVLANRDEDDAMIKDKS